MADPAHRPAAPAGAVAALLLNAFVWGVSWWPFRLLQEHGLHPLWSTALVYVVALVVVLVLHPRALRGWGEAPQLGLLAVAAGLTNVGFNWAVTVGDVVRVVLLFYLMPAWSVLLAWPLLGERPTVPALLRLVLALAGVAAVLGAGQGGFPWPRGLPDWLAIGAGFSFALTNILLRRLRRTPAPARVLAMFGGGTVMAATVATLGAAGGVVTPLPAADTAWLLPALGLTAAFLLGNAALQYGASRLPAHTTALVMLSEVVFASLSSVALGAASLGPGVLLGGTLILLAAAWSAWPGGGTKRAGTAQ